MIWALISTFIWAIAWAFTKKTTQFKISNQLNDLLSHIVALASIIFIIFLGKSNAFYDSWIDYFLVFLTFWIYYFTTMTKYYVYSKEKISNLVPYDSISRILTVLFWVLIMNDQISTTSLILNIITIIIIVWFSIDPKKLSLSRNILLYIIIQILSAVAILITAFFLVNNSAIDYYFAYVVISIFLMTIICYIWNKFVDVKNLNRTFYFSSFISSLGRLSWLISILLIKEIWLTLTTLLSFLGIGVSLASSYILFRDIPSKKNIFLTIIVTLLVFLGFYLK